MAGLEKAPLPPSWRAGARIAYPVELPQRRAVGVHYALDWFALKHVQVLDERTQVDTYLACTLLAKTLERMRDAVRRDYLLESLQTLVENRSVSGYYSHLSLGPEQRFASSGGYLVRFAGLTGAFVVPDGAWRSP
jgi:hypothetical protein